ncbi:E1-E2 ATPase-domain-containing protein [Paraphoma chrysanthemicola]|uniref:E1-E2 ATPase-domain-containing protein n=1 Tax=Paraphoma chrysanthemicola TaxID=798071 RepID=A0A8K0RKF4_9PLEO|nr:E1-E2 ATPase-domain-containing protein [Paraphoma chrysanthemicola]
MACCVITAFIMNRIIKACDTFDMHFLEIRYHDDDCAPTQEEGRVESETCRLSIDGMTCAACVNAITKALESVAGVFRAKVSLNLGRVNVSYDPALAKPQQLLQAVNSAGYQGSIGEKSTNEIIEVLRQSNELQHLRGVISSASVCAATILSLEYLHFSSNIHAALPFTIHSHVLPWLIFLLSAKVQMFDAWTIHTRAWSRVSASMDTLLSLSLILGLGLSLVGVTSSFSRSSSQPYASSGSSLTVVLLAGRYLEAVLRREGNAHLSALYEIQMDKEKYQLLGSPAVLPASLLKEGDVVVIHPHATVPCDCYIVDGTSAIDEANITGEAFPVSRGVGDFLLAGSKNINSALRVTICQDRSESSLARIIEGVTTATEQRLEGTESLDTVMQFFVSGVIVLAFATFLFTLRQQKGVPPLAASIAACERAMTVLAAACPCGLGLATPSAAMAGVDAAYTKGILLNGGIKTMNAIRNVTHVVMDKTGTLTEGRLSVLDHHFDNHVKINQAVLYRLLAAAEAEEARFHPVAKAIFKWSLKQCYFGDSQSLTTGALPETRNVVRGTGEGVNCEVLAYPNTWIQVCIGTASYLGQAGITIARSASTRSDRSVVHFAFDQQYGGYILIQDTVRPEAATVLKGILGDGLQVSMLTGDAALEAARISSLLDIPVLASRASPSDKMQYIESLREQGHRVMMVGDGNNDVMAQAVADVGVSISLTQGCLAGTGSVVILSGDLNRLAELMSISKKVMWQAKLNTRWALVYNVVALTLAMGLLEPWGIVITVSMAGSMMALSSVSVLSMSLYLRHQLRAGSETHDVGRSDSIHHG